MVECPKCEATLVPGPGGKTCCAAEHGQQRIDELTNAIKKHRDQRGDDRCFLDDQELYDVLGDGVKANTALPPKEEFLANCARYYQCRRNPDHKYETLEELKARVRTQALEDAAKVADDYRSSVHSPYANDAAIVVSQRIRALQ